MAHFAKVEYGIVTMVLVAEQEFIDTGAVGNPKLWIQTSYNTKGGVHYDPETKEPSADQSKALRKNFAGRGFTYDKILDAFIPPKPYPSWLFNESTCLWDPPAEYPTDGNHYIWNEETQTWDAT